MAALKGYRTILFNLAMLAAGAVGIHIAPDTLNQWFDFFIAFVVVVNVILRCLTNTPVFNKLAADVGLSPQQAADIERAVVAALPQGDDASAAVRELTQRIDALAGHPIFDPDLAGKLAGALAASAKPAQPQPPN
jgi:hypothetical protein